MTIGAKDVKIIKRIGNDAHRADQGYPAADPDKLFWTDGTPPESLGEFDTFDKDLVAAADLRKKS